MIFLDTSAIYAVADTTDPHHGQAAAYLDAALRRGESVLTHNYVVIESAALNTWCPEPGSCCPFRRC